MKLKTIVDVGAHMGDDTDFYLRKGFRVVAIEANPDLCEHLRYRFRKYSENRLKIYECAIAKSLNDGVDFYINLEKHDWGSLSRTSKAVEGDYKIEKVKTISLNSILDELGDVYYIKLDIEGGELDAVESLRYVDELPTYISFEVNYDRLSIIDELFDLGYTKFQLIKQGEDNLPRPPFPSKEGDFVDIEFSGTMSGVFGKELLDTWVDYLEFVEYKKNEFLDWENSGYRGMCPYGDGWWDIHAYLPAENNILNIKAKVKKLICLYTCENDRKTLEEFKKTPLYTRMSNDSSMKVIEVHAGATETKLEDGKLYLSCKESYDELSVKTYEMIKYCVSNFDFEHLVKIDSSTFGYDARRNECLGDQTIQFLYSLGEIEKVLFSTSWFNKHGDYGGAVLQPRGDRRGVESWARNRGLKVSYDKEFQSRSPAYYTGKFYFLTKEMCQYIANTGEELAVRHVKNLGGAEDMYVGRMIAEQQDNQQWYETRASWNSDHIKSKVRKPTKKVVVDRNNLIELPGDVSRDDKLVIMSCKHKRDDVTFVKRAKFGCSTLICENRRDGRGTDDDPQLDYLNYIIDNYDNLPNHMVFVHDSPFSSRRDELTHRMFFQFAKLNIPTTGFVSFTKSSQHPQKHILSKFNRTWNRYIDYEPPRKFKGSSMFAVTKEMVLSKPKSWYCSMRSAVSFDGEFGGLLGYSWHHVFKKTIQTKIL